MVNLHLDIKPLACMKENIIRDKSYLFALRIVKLYLFLSKEQREYQLSSQILRSGTSIGANIEEAIGGVSRKDFVNKLSISYKEARETNYWLRLLRDTSILDRKLADSLLKDCDELLRILYSIVNSSRSK
jgi:four helix bundle protein